MTTLLCELAGCPFAVSGDCLEALDPPDCPNTRDIDEATDELELGTDPEEDGVEDVADDIPTREYVDLVRSDALSMTEADGLASEVLCDVVLVAGEVESGKTTLLVEIFAQFLRGPYQGFAFAGSRTLSGYDKRHKLARVSSGRITPTTAGTRDDDMRFLHLRLTDGGISRNLLFTDVRGEFFEHVIDGEKVASSIPVSARADRAIVVVDGAQLSEAGKAHQAISRARQLIGGLTDPGGLSPGTRILIVCSKADRLVSGTETEVQSQLERLVSFAEQRGLVAQQMLLSARPDDPDVQLINLNAVFDWLMKTTPRTTVPKSATSDAVMERFYWVGEGAGK